MPKIVKKINRLDFLSDHEANAVTRLISGIKQGLSHQYVQAVIFGSKVRGDYHPHSDIDLFLVVKERSEVVMDKIAEISLEIDLQYDANISLIVLSEQEYQRNKAWDTPFVQNVLRDGIAL